ncbi:hypothetical protein BDW69DRAFT_45316 [Aspergillus filifer]
MGWTGTTLLSPGLGSSIGIRIGLIAIHAHPITLGLSPRLASPYLPTLPTLPAYLLDGDPTRTEILLLLVTRDLRRLRDLKSMERSMCCWAWVGSYILEPRMLSSQVPRCFGFAVRCPVRSARDNHFR